MQILPIATNHIELEALKQRGERNYVDVNLRRTKDLMQFADVGIKLNNADSRTNQYSVAILADDKMSDKKDKNVNEPLQFYVHKKLYELVIYQVLKNLTGVNYFYQIVGYLSEPK